MAGRDKYAERDRGLDADQVSLFCLDGELSPEAKFLLEDFRLAVNNAIRAGLQTRVTSRNALNKLAYKDFRRNHSQMYSQHLVSAFEVAGWQWAYGSAPARSSMT